MDLFLKHPQYLKGEFFVTNSDFFAICPHNPGPSISGLCFEYETMLKINENKDGYFDFSKALIDIGSEDGGYAIFCNFAYNYCFEANKQMCSLIYTNMYLKDKVDNTEVYNVFLGDNTDEIMFNGFSSEGGVNYDSRGRHENKKVRKHLLDEYNIKNVGLIKTDTEGFDYFVLKGGINTIKNNNYPPILFENWPVDYKEGSDVVWTKEKHDRLNNFLTDLGYTILEGWSDSMTHLAVNRKYYEKENEGVVVSMTTIPSRKDRIIDNLNSILNQSYHFDKLVINIDDNLTEEDYNFYFGLRRLDERIEVNKCDAKWRSCNKLLPTIKKYPNSVIITVDDDLEYPKDCLKFLVEKYKENNGCIVSLISNVVLHNNGVYEGYLLFSDICLNQRNYAKYLSNCCLFPPHVFDGSDLYDYDKMMECTNGTHDELWFWINSTINGVKVVTVDNYLENVDEFELYDYKDKTRYCLSPINSPEKVSEYAKRINRIYGERLCERLSEKVEFNLNSENLYTLFYNFFIVRDFYKNYVFNLTNLPKGKIRTLREFLGGSGISLDDVVAHPIEPERDFVKGKNCLFAMCNDKYADYCAIMISSFLDNNKWFDGDIIVMYLENELSDDNIRRFKSLSNLVSVHEIDKNNYKDDSVENTIGKAYSHYYYYKMECFRDIFSKYDRAVYLDSDIVVKGDISDLFLDDNDFVWCTDGVYNDICNAGVFGFNSKKLCGPFFNQFFDFVKTHRNENFYFADQSILNIIMRDFQNVKIENKNLYNHLVTPLNPLVNDYEVWKNARILHFADLGKDLTINSGECLPSYDYYKYYYLTHNNLIGKKEKIILSMTTIPSRKNTLKINIESILNQDCHFDKFVINIDDNLSQEDYDFYYSLTEMDKRIEVYKCDAKWRSCNKLLPTLAMYPDDVIITLDDDFKYPKNSIKSLLDAYEKYSDCIITQTTNPITVENGKFTGYHDVYDFSIKQKAYTKYLSNCCLFPPHTFDNTDLYDYDKMIECTNGTHDELWFWINSTINGVKVVCISQIRDLGPHIIWESYSDGYRLCNINSQQSNIDYYNNKIIEMYGEQIDKVVGNDKVVFKLTCDNIYDFYYRFWFVKTYYMGNFVLDVSDLDKSYYGELEAFLNGSNIKFSDVVRF